MAIPPDAGSEAERKTSGAATDMQLFNGRFMSGGGGIFKVLALLFTAIFNPEALGDEFGNPLAQLLGFDNADDMKTWRESAGGDFMKGLRTANWHRIDTSRVDQEYHKFAKLVDSKNPLLELIGKHESGGDYNRVYGGKRPLINGKPITEVCVDDVIDWQEEQIRCGAKSTACGKYQIICKTLKGLKSEMGLTGNEIFDEKMQDRMAIKLMERRGLDKFVRGDLSEQAFMRNLSQEWAALPKDASGLSFYHGDGLNRAGVAPETVLAAARVTKDRALNGTFAEKATEVAPEGESTVHVPGKETVVADADIAKDTPAGTTVPGGPGNGMMGA